MKILGIVEIKPSKPEWRRAARLGDLIHNHIVSLCNAQDVLEVAEKPLRDLVPDVGLLSEYNVSGRVDAILQRNGKRRCLEIKSTNAKAFSRFAPGDEKFADAYYQLQLYLWALKIESGFILAVDRDSCRVKEFAVDPDEPTVLAILAKLKRLQAHVEAKTLPSPEPSDHSCAFCGFRGTEHCMTAEERDWI